MHLEHFKNKEFREWVEKMSPKLLAYLDLFRHRLGRRIQISPVNGALGRNGEGKSQHYWENWGEVRAVDVLPEGMLYVEDARTAVRLAIECGFTGIGLYPHWRPSPGLHLDVRDTAKMGSPALWGAMKIVKDGKESQQYITLEKAYRLMPRRAA